MKFREEFFGGSSVIQLPSSSLEGKDGSYHPESFDNDVVSYKRTGDNPRITITYKTAKKRPMWKKFCLEGKIKRLGKR